MHTNLKDCTLYLHRYIHVHTTTHHTLLCGVCCVVRVMWCTRVSVLHHAVPRMVDHAHGNTPVVVKLDIPVIRHGLTVQVFQLGVIIRIHREHFGQIHAMNKAIAAESTRGGTRGSNGCIVKQTIRIGGGEGSKSSESSTRSGHDNLLLVVPFDIFIIALLQTITTDNVELCRNCELGSTFKCKCFTWNTVGSVTHR